MIIGFDVSQTGKLKAGCGYVAHSLIESFAQSRSENQFLLYPNFGDFFFDPSWEQNTFRSEDPRFRILPLESRRARRASFWNDSHSNLDEKMGFPDIVHSNNFFCPTALRKSRLVYTLHDLSFVENPEWTTEDIRIGCFRGVFEASIFADFVVAVSEYSKNHFLNTFPYFPRERIEVAYPASRVILNKEHHRPTCLSTQILKDQFFLMVGTLEPRKNHRRLLEAYQAYRKSVAHPKLLVLAGAQGWLLGDLEKSEGVLQLGYVENESLEWLYQNCFAFTYPSLFEGFGLPVIEAMSLGVPVMTSKVSSIPEVGGSAVYYVDPYSVESLRAALVELDQNSELRNDLCESGKRQAARFSWEKTAQQVLDLYARVLRLPKRHP